MKNNRKVNNLNDEIQMPLPTNFGITVACKFYVWGEMCFNWREET